MWVQPGWRRRHSALARVLLSCCAGSCALLRALMPSSSVKGSAAAHVCTPCQVAERERVAGGHGGGHVAVDAGQPENFHLRAVEGRQDRHGIVCRRNAAMAKGGAHVTEFQAQGAGRLAERRQALVG